jgi:hypothetical protein
MTRDGLQSIEALTETDIATFSSELGIPAFISVNRSLCTSLKAHDLISIRTATGNHIITTLTQEFVLSTSGSSNDFDDSLWDTAEIIPAGLLDIGQRMYALDRSGAIIGDSIIDIEPVDVDFSMCTLDHPENYFPVIFAGGLGILSG